MKRWQRYFAWREVAQDVCVSVFEFENKNGRTDIYVLGVANGHLKIVGEPVVLTDVKILEC